MGTKPWWTSKILITQVVAVAALIAGHYGVTVFDNQDAAVGIIDALLTSVFRVTATTTVLTASSMPTP